MDLSPWDLTGILAGLVALAIGLAVVAVTARRTASSRVSTAASRARPGAADAGAPTLTRRRLLERGAVVAAGSAMVGVVASAISYLTDALGGPGNRTYTVGTLEAVRAAVGRRDSPFFYNPSAGFYVVAYPEADLERARAAYGGTELAGMEAGFVALDQTCTHLGCRVPYCRSSAWFECPCHGSRFNGVGELRRGPAPRGLDRYAVRVVDGKVVVDTSKKVVGPPPGVDTTHQDPAGPHCR